MGIARRVVRLMFDALLSSPHEDPANPLFSDTGIACYAREAAPAEVSSVQVFAHVAAEISGRRESEERTQRRRTLA